MTDSLQETISNEGMVLVYNCMVDQKSAEDYKTNFLAQIPMPVVPESFRIS
ncbi:MAG: hypothetical protein KAU17_16295 [Spirochaetales bacterium]|nr:hypothetical protein [Spirochaetales bacterium]